MAFSSVIGIVTSSHKIKTLFVLKSLSQTQNYRCLSKAGEDRGIEATVMSSKNKRKLNSFNLYRDYCNSFTLSNASELFLSRIPRNNIQVQKEKENLAVPCFRPP